MGKKSHHHRGNLSAHKRSELKLLADAILIKCREEPADEFENYVEIYNLLERVIKNEHEIKHLFKVSRTQSMIEEFIEWCKEEGAKFPKIDIKSVDDFDLGLIAKEPLKENEIFIEIPESMIFSYSKIENAIPAVLKQKLFTECPLFENMSHVRLALALILEKLNPDSKFKRYFDVLPEKYRTVLYFTPSEMKELEGTTALKAAIKQVKFIATQYAFLYKYLMVTCEEKSDPIMDELREDFNYEFYRWAVSCVMTRQNLIPKDDERTESALIPCWDMANHANGIVNTQFNLESKQIESFCLKDFRAGEQVTIAYGNRSNLDFLIHNGFVFRENLNRDLFINLHLNKTDVLYDVRLKLLEKIGLRESGNFQISPACSSELLGFIRIFNMTKDQLDQWHKSATPRDLLDVNLDLDVAFQRKIRQSLLIRVKIAMRMFKTAEDEDLELVYSGMLTKTKTMLVLYRICERNILNDVVSSLEDQIRIFTP